MNGCPNCPDYLGKIDALEAKLSALRSTLRQVQAERDEACKRAELAESADLAALTQCQDSLDKQLSLTKKLRNEIRVLWQRLRDANRGAECNAKVAWGMAKELAQVQAERDEAQQIVCSAYSRLASFLHWARPHPMQINIAKGSLLRSIEAIISKTKS